MVANSGKFKAATLDKWKSDHTNESITADDQKIKVVSSAKHLGIKLYEKLNFNLHISNIFRSPANQLNALIWLKNLWILKRRKFS